MKNKILFVDLDATLLSDDKTISAANRDAIQRMQEQGHYLALSTGRTVESGRIVARELGLTRPGCYMIAFNGAVIYDCSADRVLMKRSLSIETVEEIFARAKKAGIYVHTYGNTDVITSSHTKELDYYCKDTQLSYKLSHSVLDALQEEPHKVLLIDLKSKERLAKFQKENLHWEKGKCSSFFSCDKYLEYCPPGVDKGYGLEQLTEILNMSPDCTVAVGDEQNDIPMLRKAKIGIAMKNGTEEVKKIADYITEKDNNSDGIAEVIEKFIL